MEVTKMNESKIQWTKEYFEDLNKRSAEYGLPQVVIADGYVYKDELHRLLGIGVKLQES